MARETAFRPNTAGTVNAAYTGTAGTTAAFTNGGVYRVWCSTDAYIDVGPSASAAATDMPVTGGVYEYIVLTALDKVSAIQQSTGGTMFVTPVELY